MDTGIIILIVVGVAFLALGIWAFTIGREYKFPEGPWVEHVEWGVRLRVVYDKGLGILPGPAMARDLAWFVDAAATAWIERWPKDADVVTKTVAHVVVFVRPAEFAGQCRCGGIQGWVFRPIGGSDIPLVSIPMTSTDRRLPAFIVHEVLHAIRAKARHSADPLHGDRSVWGDTETRAKEIARGPRA